MLNKVSSIRCVNDACGIRPPLSSDGDKSLPLIIFYMNLMQVEAVAVIDENNYCIGFATSEDVVSQIDEETAEDSNTVLRDVMRQPTMSVYLDDPIEQALNMMKFYQLDWLPVISYKTKKFTGLICREDIEELSVNIIPFVKRKISYGEAA